MHNLHRSGRSGLSIDWKEKPLLLESWAFGVANNISTHVLVCKVIVPSLLSDSSNGLSGFKKTDEHF